MLPWHLGHWNIADFLSERALVIVLGRPKWIYFLRSLWDCATILTPVIVSSTICHRLSQASLTVPCGTCHFRSTSERETRIGINLLRQLLLPLQMILVSICDEFRYCTMWYLWCLEFSSALSSLSVLLLYR